MKNDLNIKLIALDLDDTTLHSDATLSPEVENAIKRAIAAGVEIAVASGRSLHSLPKSVLNIGGIRYAITSNGSAVCRISDGEALACYTLRPESVSGILEYFSSELMETFIDGQAYCDARYYDDPAAYNCPPAYVDYVKTTRIPVKNMPEFIKANAGRLESVDLRAVGAEMRARLWEKAEKIEGLYVTSSSPLLLEMADENAGKAQGLKFLCEYLGIPRESCAAFGNGDNDAEMLRWAGLGVAVKNASKLCLEAADLIGPSNDEDCVARVLEEVLGI